MSEGGVTQVGFITFRNHFVENVYIHLPACLPASLLHSFMAKQLSVLLSITFSATAYQLILYSSYLYFIFLLRFPPSFFQILINLVYNLHSSIISLLVDFFLPLQVSKSLSSLVCPSRLEDRARFLQPAMPSVGETNLFTSSMVFCRGRRGRLDVGVSQR